MFVSPHRTVVCVLHKYGGWMCVCTAACVAWCVCVLHKLGGEVCVSVAWLNVLHNKCVSWTSGEEGSVFVCMSIPWLCAAWHMSLTSVEDAGSIFIEWLCVAWCVRLSQAWRIGAYVCPLHGCVLYSVCVCLTQAWRRGVCLCVSIVLLCVAWHVSCTSVDSRCMWHTWLCSSRTTMSSCLVRACKDPRLVHLTPETSPRHTHARPVVQRRVSASGTSVAPIPGTWGHPLPSIWIQPNLRSCNWEQKCRPRAGARALPWEEMPLNQGSRGRIAPSAALFEKHPIWV